MTLQNARKKKVVGKSLYLIKMMHPLGVDSTSPVIKGRKESPFLIALEILNPSCPIIPLNWIFESCCVLASKKLTSLVTRIRCPSTSFLESALTSVSLWKGNSFKVFYFTAMQEISTFTFFGSLLTSTVSRAGGFDLKY